MEEGIDSGNALEGVALAANRIASAITPGATMPGYDETGETVYSLTEAVMGITAGLVRVAEAISDLAAAVRETARK